MTASARNWSSTSRASGRMVAANGRRSDAPAGRHAGPDRSRLVRRRSSHQLGLRLRRRAERAGPVGDRRRSGLEESFIEHRVALPAHDDTRMPRAASDDQPVLAFAFDLGSVGDKPWNARSSSPTTRSSPSSTTARICVPIGGATALRPPSCSRPRSGIISRCPRAAKRSTRSLWPI